MGLGRIPRCAGHRPTDMVSRCSLAATGNPPEDDATPNGSEGGLMSFPDNFRAIPLTRIGEGKTKTILIPLPRDAWVETDRCKCHHCQMPGRKTYWDTLAVSARPRKGCGDFTWLTHAPYLHGEPRQPEAPQEGS